MGGIKFMSTLSNSPRAFAGIAAVVLSLTLGAGLSEAATAACSQSAIQSIAPAGTTIVSATPQTDPVAYCDVTGYVTTENPGPNQVSLEIGLPANWNGRFLMIGNGGFAGSLDYPSVFLTFIDPSPLQTEVSAGFATVITDAGHEGIGPNPFLDGTWALNDPAAQLDWLVRGAHVAAVAGKFIARGFYKRKSRSYFMGCSDGGREGLIEAEKFPTDFDGIVAGDPLLGNAFLGFNWNAKHLLATPDNYLTADKLDLVTTAVMQSCDAADGVADGLIQDPRRCHFDPAKLLCHDGDSSACLTAGQVATLKAIYAGARTVAGQQIYPGFTSSDPSGDPSLVVEDGWDLWITGFVPPDSPGSSEPWSNPDLEPWQFTLQDQFLKYSVFGDPTYDSLGFNFNGRDLLKAEAAINQYGAAATDPDLSLFRDEGGKLILYHGWSDPALAPLATIQYYDSVLASKSNEERGPAQQFARLFMAPGMRHCIGSGGPGPNFFDPLTPVINWVEQGTAPGQILAAHFQNNDPTSGIVTRTMPLCPYPEAAVFNGGDVNDAANWTCKLTARPDREEFQ
jgi:feruloyl esterase